MKTESPDDGSWKRIVPPLSPKLQVIMIRSYRLQGMCQPQEADRDVWRSGIPALKSYFKLTLHLLFADILIGSHPCDSLRRWRLQSAASCIGNLEPPSYVSLLLLWWWRSEQYLNRSGIRPNLIMGKPFDKLQCVVYSMGRLRDWNISVQDWRLCGLDASCAAR